MSRFVLTKEAEESLVRIYLYTLSAFGPKQAESYEDGFQHIFSLIADNPYMGAACDEIVHRYRRHVWKAHVIYYRVEESSDVVRIVDVLGAAQDAFRHFRNAPEDG